MEDIEEQPKCVKDKSPSLVIKIDKTGVLRQGVDVK